MRIQANPNVQYQADLATERERQLTTARANQTTGLTNDRAENHVYSFPRAFPLSTDVPVLLLNQPIVQRAIQGSKIPMTSDLNTTVPKPSFMILLQQHLFQSTVQLKRNQKAIYISQHCMLALISQYISAYYLFLDCRIL